MEQTSIQVPAELFALAESSRFEGIASLPALEAGPDDYVFDAPISWWVDVTNTGSALLVAGKATGTGVCACSRCLEGVAHEFDADIEGYFLVGPNGGFDEGDDEAPGDDEFEVLPDDHIIDLMPLIIAALIVDAPEQPLCRDDCKGLCPQCGANLNEGPCGCAKKPDPMNPFSVLADYDFG